MTLAHVQSALDGSPLPPEAANLVRRLADAVAGVLRRDDSAGNSDVAVLLRQSLVRFGAATGVSQAAVRVPNGPPWPPASFWETFGLHAVPAGSNQLRIEARRWAPDWLDATAPSEVEAAIAAVRRRPQRSVPIDPLLREYFPSLDSYSTPGQREAVHAAFLSPEGSTTIVVLPTGAGKTLAFQAPALRWRHAGGLVLVIVPTVALARDQEARFRELAPDLDPSIPLAYHSGLRSDERLALNRAVTAGEVPILFASPEAALGALRAPLHRAAETARLRLFAIDEAHTVATWGDDFRPEFQALSGLRHDLLKASGANPKFRTLLLTATLTSEAHDALVRLFPSADSHDASKPSCEVIAEVALRAEPSFLMASSDTRATRDARVLESLRHLPRPLLLYTTKRDDAQRWEVLLRQNGYARVRAVVGGDMATEFGERVLEDWRSGRVDVTVATSAFGLGMDQSEVRSVVHACLPETIDRYYQEVGRAGRDGNAAVSLLLWEPEDIRVATSLVSEAVLSEGRAFERWQAMWTSSERQSRDGVVLLPLDAPPPGYTLSSERNRSWNLRTLGLVARAGFVQFAAPTRPVLEQADTESIDAFETRCRELAQLESRRVGVRILDTGVHTRGEFEARIRAVRQSRLGEDRDSIDLVKELTRLRRPLHELLRATYTVEDAGIEVAKSTVSCPVTRTRGVPAWASESPPLRPLKRTMVDCSPRLVRAIRSFGDSSGRTVLLSYEPPVDRRTQDALEDLIARLLQRVVSEGVSEFTIPPAFLRKLSWGRLADRSPSGFVMRASSFRELDHGVDFPRVAILQDDVSAADLHDALTARTAESIIVVSKSLRDLDRPDRRLIDARQSCPVRDFLGSLDS